MKVAELSHLHADKVESKKYSMKKLETLTDMDNYFLYKELNHVPKQALVFDYSNPKKTMQGFETELKEGNYSIVLDWLSIYFKNIGLIDCNDIAYTEGDEIRLSETVVLKYCNSPTPHFKSTFELYMDNTKVAYLLTHSRNEKFFAKDIVKVEFINHTLYSGVWLEVYNLLKISGLRFNKFSRIDIAIDGVAYLNKMLNYFQHQPSHFFKLKNQSVRRAKFEGDVYNFKTLHNENFQLGNGNSDKMITLYNKSLEIVKSGKEYIQDYWLLNGVIKEKNDLNARKNELSQRRKHGEQVFNLDGLKKDIYRFEIRMRSEAIKQIKDLTVDKLFSKEYLMSIVRTQCKNFFEMVHNDDSNVSRCTPIELLPYEKFEGKILNKIKRVERDLVRTTKNGIHADIKHIYRFGSKTQGEDLERINALIDHIRVGLWQYNLFNWLSDRLEQWHKEEWSFVKESRQSDVLAAKQALMDEIDLSIEDVYGIAERHQQSVYTAQFGDF